MVRLACVMNTKECLRFCSTISTQIKQQQQGTHLLLLAGLPIDGCVHPEQSGPRPSSGLLGRSSEGKPRRVKI